MPFFKLSILWNSVECFSFLFTVHFFFPLSQVRAVDEMNYDFQALALESRGMGEVRGVWS